MNPSALPLIKGTVDMLVLKALSWGPTHGFGVSLWLEQESEGTLMLDDSMAYQVLHRLEGRGLIEAEWRMTENNRRARFYSLTPAGRAHLRTESRAWQRYSQSVSTVMASRTRPAGA